MSRRRPDPHRLALHRDSPQVSRRDPWRSDDGLEERYKPSARPASPWALHELLDVPQSPFRGTPARGPRFQDTRDVLSYGVKLGLGKASQALALKQLKARFPQHASMFDDPLFLAGVKMALPLLGIQLAHRLRDQSIAAQLLDASQGMLLVNTIDLTADLTHALADHLVEMGEMVLKMYGVSNAEATQGARQLADDFDLNALLTELAPRTVPVEPEP
ncbi:MAG: hypothetical protein AAFV53_30860 [Myxococcota bacterium]